MTTTKTTCPYCGVGCGVLATQHPDGTVTVKGDPDHPANYGRLCSKGSALGETVELDNRLLYPEIDGERATWDAALDTVGAGFKKIIDEHGPDAVAFYASGQMLTEDYYIANKLMKGYIGTANIDTNSRLCMSSAVAAHKRAFGADTVPQCYEDLEACDLLVLVGSNLAWCHPVLYQRIKAAKAKRSSMKIMVVDPRRTDTCEIADLHLPIAPGSDTWLFNGLLVHLAEHGCLDEGYLSNYTQGVGEALQAAEASAASAEVTAKQCDVELAKVQQFFQWFAGTRRVVTGFSMGVNQSSAGTDKCNAIINVHLATGRIGREGAGPFSITGQPNAMGGREAGGLANMLAAHMDFDESAQDRVRRFWRSPTMASAPGLKAVDLFRAIDKGEVKAVWIMATNPVVSVPDANRVRRALRKCELVVVSDCTQTDTTDCAKVILPAHGWAEKDGTVTNTERRISRQRGYLEAPGEAKPDWWAIQEVARRMGYEDGFAYAGPYEIFDEHARLSGFENGGSRDFDITGLTGLDKDGYDAMPPRQWPLPARDAEPRQRFFAEGGFYHADGRARLVPIKPRSPAEARSNEFPFVLNTGRIRDQWHTMSRTATAARLNAHIAEPFAHIHSGDAAVWKIPNGGLVRVKSRWGEVLVRAVATDQQRPGEVFVPMHWSDQHAAKARVDAVVNPAVDPVSGEPEFKHTPINIGAVTMAWHGFLISREPLPNRPDADYWVRIKGKQFYRYELAGAAWHSDVQAWAQPMLGEDGERLEFSDPNARRYHAAILRDGRVQACLFIGPTVSLPARQWLSSLFDKDSLDLKERRALLSGMPPVGQEDQGETVCACFGVGANVIKKHIRAGCGTPAEVTKACKAGGNCGSCVGEIGRMIEAEKAARKSA